MLSKATWKADIGALTTIALTLEFPKESPGVLVAFAEPAPFTPKAKPSLAILKSKKKGSSVSPVNTFIGCPL